MKDWKKDVGEAVGPISLVILLLLSASFAAVVVSTALLTIAQMWGLL